MALTLVLVGCATTGKKVQLIRDQGAWSGKVRIENKVNQSSHTLDLEFVAQKDRNLRMDVTAGLGIYLASFVMQGDQIRYLLARQKKFYFGRVSDYALRPVLGISLNPSLLQDLLFDTQPNNSQFKCERDAKHLLSQCVSKDGLLMLTWKKREDDGARVVVIHSAQADLTLYIGPGRPNVQLTAKTFQLNAPEGFHRYRLN